MNDQAKSNITALVDLLDKNLADKRSKLNQTAVDSSKLDIQQRPDGLWVVMWRNVPYGLVILGVPMGRGTTRGEAVEDLIERTSLESAANIYWY